MLVVHDERLVVLIAKGIKTAHRIPASVDAEGRVRHPRISPSDQVLKSHPERDPHHKVYVHSPHGSHGNPYEPPRLTVDVRSVERAMLADMRDEDAQAEGFSNLYAYRDYWNRHKHKDKKWYAWSYRPIWVIYFTIAQILPAGEELIELLRVTE